MSAYIVGHINVTDPSWMEEYQPKTQALVAKHGGRYVLAGGEMEALEGNPSLPSAMVILEFPDAAAARAWYNDDEYAPMIALRQTGATAELVLVDAPE